MKVQLLKSTLKLAFAGLMVASFAVSTPALAHSRKWKERQAALAAQQAYEQQQAQAAYQAQQQAYYQQQQAQARAQADAQAQAQAAYQAQVRANAQNTFVPAPQPQIVTNGAQNMPPVALDVNGLPIVKPLTVAQQRLKEFRDQPPQNMPVIITQAEWTPAVETQYSAFVAFFGKGVRQSPKRSIKSYMRDPKVNMYASTDPQDVIFYSDCADLPYFLRSYFAYKNGLPMSIAADPVMSQQPYASMPDRQNDLLDPSKTDSSPYGNILSRRALSNIVSAPNREFNYLTYWSKLMDQGSTRTFRVGPLSPNYGLSDVYPVKIDTTNIHPGTIVHSNGHILVVFEVTTDGTVNAIDAHPDNSVQFKTIDASNLERSRPDHGFGFLNFRPTKAVGGKWLPSPTGKMALYGAQIVSATDADLFAQGKWSMEQYFGPGTNVAPGSQVDPNAWKRAYGNIKFFDYLRTALSGSITTPADVAAGALMTSLCDNLTQRVPDVVAPPEVLSAPRPSTIPANIYSATDNWEAFSTASRDGRSREAIVNLPKDIIAKYKSGIRNELKLTYNGTASQYQQQIINRLALVDATCKATYVKSDGTTVTMNLSEMMRRAPRLSFDMSDCPEKRWGAEGSEMKSCRDQDPSNAWYNAEQSIRNTLNKTDADGNFLVRSPQPITLDMLRSGRYTDQPASSSINLGTSRSPFYDVKGYFSSPQFLQDLSR